MRNKKVRFNLSHNEREKEFIENKSQKFGFKSVSAFLLDCSKTYFRFDIDMSVYKNLTKEVTCYFSKIKGKRTYFSPRGVLILRKEKIVDSNIRCIRIEKGIGQTELVKQLQLNDVEITRETLVKIEIESGRQHIKLEQLKSIKKY